MGNETQRSLGKTLVWSITIVVIVVLSGFLIWKYSGPRNQSLEKITIAQAGDFFLYAPLYLAVDAKLFSEEGLDVSIVSTGGDEKTWASVIGKSASFGVADPTFIAISAEKGKPGKIIASMVNGVPFWGVTYKKNIAPFKQASDLNGYTVATFPSPSTAYALQKQYFMSAGLNPKIKEGAFGTILAMLKANQADIGLELEPNVSQAVADGASVVYSLSKSYGDFAITGLTTTPELIRDRPALVQKVVSAIQSALNYCRSNRESALAILVKRFPEVSTAAATAAFNRVLDEKIIPESVIINDAAWTKAIQLRLQSGELKSPAAFTEFVNNTFAEKAIATTKH